MLHSPSSFWPARGVAIPAVALAAATLLAACGESAAVKPAAPATEVGVATLKAQSVDLTRELSGRTVAAETAEIRPQISGIVQARLFEEDQMSLNG